MKPKEVLDKLEKHATADPDFTSEEKALIRQIIEAYRGWSALGKATKGFIAFLVIVSGGVTAGGIILGALKSWLRLP